jgi:hypothetical protein
LAITLDRRGASAAWHDFGDPAEPRVRSHRMSWSFPLVVLLLLRTGHVMID